jgi:hypothetical protein
MTQRADFRVDVLEAYHSFRPRIDFRQTVLELLQGICPDYLVGLKRVVLRDSGGFSRAEKKKRQRRPSQDLLGTYYHATHATPPRIDLFVDAIATRWPGIVLKIPLLRQILIGNVLFHEVGHHIHARIKPEFKDPESAAEAWARRLSREFAHKRHPYLTLALKPLGKAMRRSRLSRMKLV